MIGVLNPTTGTFARISTPVPPGGYSEVRSSATYSNGGQSLTVVVGGGLKVEGAFDRADTTIVLAEFGAMSPDSATLRPLPVLPEPRAFARPLVFHPVPGDAQVMVTLLGGSNYSLNRITFERSDLPLNNGVVGDPNEPAWATTPTALPVDGFNRLGLLVFYDPVGPQVLILDPSNATSVGGRCQLRSVLRDGGVDAGTTADGGVTADAGAISDGGAAADGGPGPDGGAGCAPESCACVPGTSAIVLGGVDQRMTTGQVDCPLVGGKTGVTATLSASGTAQGAQCPTCRATANLAGFYEGKIDLCRDSASLTGSASYVFARQLTAVCSEATCTKTCGEPHCDSESLSAQGTLRVTRSYPFKKELRWKVLGLKTRCTWKASLALRGAASYSQDNGTSCSLCQTGKVTASASGRATIDCNVGLQVAGRDFSIACPRCGKLELEIAGSVDRKAGVCGDSSCLGVDIRAEAELATPCTPRVGWGWFTLLRPHRCFASLKATAGINTCGTPPAIFDPKISCRAAVETECQ
jgi:hypothetical protein